MGHGRWKLSLYTFHGSRCIRENCENKVPHNVSPIWYTQEYVHVCNKRGKSVSIFPYIALNVCRELCNRHFRHKRKNVRYLIFTCCTTSGVQKSPAQRPLYIAASISVLDYHWDNLHTVPKRLYFYMIFVVLEQVASMGEEQVSK